VRRVFKAGSDNRQKKCIPAVHTMSSTPTGPLRDYVVGVIPPLLGNIVGSSSETLPSEADIDRLRKEVDDFYLATRKQAGRYQKDLSSLVARHGTSDQARRRDAQKIAAKQDEGERPLFPSTQPCVNNAPESESESDVPLRKKRKLDDTSRASTPLISTPKCIAKYFRTC
jgi:hypothetical protein